MSKPFVLLSRVIEFRNVLAHSYFDYELQHTEPISGVIKNQSKNNDEIIFDKQFQEDVSTQFAFIDLMLTYIYEVLLEKGIKYHIYSAFHTIMGLDTGEYGKTVFPEGFGKIEDYFAKITAPNFGVNRYFKK
ncbi:MAG: hypothetical protein IPO70_04430 [Bacteroidetes bacterium]|nr:hypothetical protein [Bacteroidota bacterium]